MDPEVEVEVQEQTPEQVQEQQAIDAAAEEAGFSESFGEAPAVPADAKPDAVVEQAQPEQQPEDQAAKPETAEERAQRLTEEITGLNEKSVLTEKDIRKIYGKFGELQSTVNELKESGSGTKLNLSKETFKRLNENGLEDIAEMLAADLSEALSSSGGGQDKSQSSVDEQVAKVRTELEGKFDVKLQQSILSLSHRDWPTVYQSQDFQDWVKTQSEDDQKLLHDGWDALSISDKLTEFKAYREQKNKTALKNKERLKQNLTPQGTPTEIKTGLVTEQDGFEAAFKT